MSEDLRLEAVAAECHKQWSGWTEHFISKCSGDSTGFAVILDRVWIDRWKRQIATEYKDLTEEEKESDRREARKILEALKKVEG